MLPLYENRSRSQPILKNPYIIAILLFFSFLLLVYLYKGLTTSEFSPLCNTSHPPSPSLYSPSDSVFTFAVIEDRDKDNQKGRTLTYESTLKVGECKRNAKGYEINWLRDVTFTSTLNEKGRGFELSELIFFHNRLLSFDDRSGLLYELKGNLAIPRMILMEGDGDQKKGFKIEWVAEKDGLLYVGSIGKEWTTPQGKFVNNHLNYVKVLDRNLQVIKVLDWTPVYEKIKETLGLGKEGYLIHEAVRYDNKHKEWVFLPRKESTAAYDDVLDEMKGSNAMVVANEDLTQFRYARIGHADPKLGFSSFDFVPNSDDLIALKSEEHGDTLQTWIMIFSRDGPIRYDLSVFAPSKYEGIAFVPRHFL